MERVPQCCVRAHRHPATFEQCAALCTSTGVAAHATPVSMRCSVMQCGVAQRFWQQTLGVAEAKEDCGHGDGRRAVCRSSACVSSHEQSVRQHVHWRGECGRARAPYSIDLVEPSTCELGSRAGDRARSAPCAEHLRTANRHSK